MVKIIILYDDRIIIMKYKKFKPVKCISNYSYNANWWNGVAVCDKSPYEFRRNFNF